MVDPPPAGPSAPQPVAMSFIPPPFPGQRPDLNEKFLKGRHDEFAERARKDHLSDEVRPPWWVRLRRALRGRRSSTPPSS
jgi:hypothetical protein